MIKLSAADKKHLSALLTPSGLSGVIAISIGLVVTVGVIIAFSFEQSSIQQQLIAWQEKQPQRTLTTPDQTLPENDRPSLSGSWPLLIVWGVIGLMTYMAAASIARSISNMYQLRKSLDYVHAQPQSLLQATAEHIILRLVAAGILAGLVYFFVKQILPYSISASHAAAADLLSTTGLLYGLLSFAVVVVSIHIQTIFFRLALGKVRVLSDV